MLTLENTPIEYRSLQPGLDLAYRAEVGDLSGDKALTLEEALLSAEEAPANADGIFWTKEVQIMRTGTFLFRGQTLTIDTSMFDGFIRNFHLGVCGLDANGDPKPLPVYKDHRLLGTESYGRLTRMRHDGANLWAEVRFNPKGQRYIAEESYTELSAEFYPGDYVDPEGKRWREVMKAISFVGDPNLKHMASVQMSEDERSFFFILSEAASEKSEDFATNLTEDHIGLVCFSERMSGMADDRDDRKDEQHEEPERKTGSEPETASEGSEDFAARLADMERRLQAAESENKRLAVEAQQSALRSQQADEALEKAQQLGGERLLAEHADVILPSTPEWIKELAFKDPKRFQEWAASQKPLAEFGERGYPPTTEDAKARDDGGADPSSHESEMQRPPEIPPEIWNDAKARHLIKTGRVMWRTYLEKVAEQPEPIGLRDLVYERDPRITFPCARQRFEAAQAAAEENIEAFGAHYGVTARAHYKTQYGEFPPGYDVGMPVMFGEAEGGNG